MEYNIYDLMNGLQDDSVPLPEDDAAGLRRIKELTMNKIQENQGTRGVRPHRRAALFAQRHGALHHQRIACMEATGHIGRCDKRDHLFIHSDGIRAKAFAQVTV